MSPQGRGLDIAGRGAAMSGRGVASGVLGQTPVGQHGQLSTSGSNIVDAAGNPVQLTGMSTHGIQWHGLGDDITTTTNGSVDTLVDDWNADVLRIAMYVSSSSNGYLSDPTGLTADVNTLVNEAANRGIYAIIDWHILGSDPMTNVTDAETFFNDVSTAHAGKENVIYEICNEPHNVTWARIKEYADRVIPVIRGNDPDGLVICGTRGYSSFGLAEGAGVQEIIDSPLTQSNVAYSFHFYSNTHGDTYRNELSYAADNIPVYATEWGAMSASGDGTGDLVSSQAFVDIMANKNVSWAPWSYSDDYRSSGIWYEGTPINDGPWTTDSLTDIGRWYRSRIQSPATGPDRRVLDNFEHNDLAGNYTNTSTSYNITTATAARGNHSLAVNTGSDSLTFSNATLINGRDEQYRFAYQPPSGSSYAKAVLAASGTGYADVSGYLFQFDTANNEFELFRVDGGGNNRTIVFSVTTGFTYTAGEWYTVETDLRSDGEITARLIDSTGTVVASGSGTDANYAIGKIAWGGNTSGGTAYFDALTTEPAAGSNRIESFEATDPVAAYTGDTLDASVITTPTFDGSQALQLANSTGFSIIHRSDVAFGPGTRFSYRVYDPAGGEFNFGLQAGNDAYRAQTTATALTIARQDPVNGYTSLNSSGYSPPAGEWIRVVVEWATDGTITVTAYNSANTQLGTVSATDTSLTQAGGFGYSIYQGTMTTDYLVADRTNK